MFFLSIRNCSSHSVRGTNSSAKKGKGRCPLTILNGRVVNRASRRRVVHIHICCMYNMHKKIALVNPPPCVPIRERLTLWAGSCRPLYGARIIKELTWHVVCPVSLESSVEEIGSQEGSPQRDRLRPQLDYYYCISVTARTTGDRRASHHLGYCPLIHGHVRTIKGAVRKLSHIFSAAGVHAICY